MIPLTFFKKYVRPTPSAPKKTTVIYGKKKINKYAQSNENLY